MNYYLHNSDMSIDMKTNTVTVHDSKAEPFKVTLVETGVDTMTAGRLKRVQKYIGDEDFMLTYGDGVAHINLDDLVAHHNSTGKIATMTAIQPGSRFGILNMDSKDDVLSFAEKPKDDGAWINGGFFVLKPEVFNYLHNDADDIMWERQPLDDLAKDSQLAAYKLNDFWKCMDTLRDCMDLNEMWEQKPEWKVWND